MDPRLKLDKSRRSPVAGALASCQAAFWGVGLISLVINLLMLTGPLFMLQVYDRVLTSRSVPTLVVLVGLAGVLFVFFGLLEAVRARSLSRIGQKLDARLSGNSYEAAASLPLVLGREGERLEPVRDLELLRQFLASAGPAAIFDMPWMPVYLAIIFAFHPLLGWLAVGGAIIILTLVVLNEVLVRKPMGELAQLSARRTAAVGAARRNAEVVSAMGMLKALTGRWETDNRAFLKVQQQAADRSSLFSTAIKAFRFLLQSAVLGLGAWLAIRQEVSPGIMIAASIITSRALAPVEQAVANWRGFIAARLARKRLVKVFEVNAAREPETELPAPRRELQVENLATTAPGERKVLVQGVKFRLKAGDGLGIIGPSGSGKTSLLRALVGIWPALNGTVRLDGAEFNQWARASIGRSIGYLPQDVELFDGSIAENIARFDPGRSDADILEAARLAGVHELVTGLPDGFDTAIGEGGARLSAGQRQRIGLARALYGAPFLVALDEPNSNLDGDGEAALTVAIKEMRAKGSIVIVVAHRPSAIAAVDQLLWIREGRQVAFGPKDEVLKHLNKPAGPGGPGGPLKVVKTNG